MFAVEVGSSGSHWRVVEPKTAPTVSEVALLVGTAPQAMLFLVDRLLLETCTAVTDALTTEGLQYLTLRSVTAQAFATALEWLEHYRDRSSRYWQDPPDPWFLPSPTAGAGKPVAGSGAPSSAPPRTAAGSLGSSCRSACATEGLFSADLFPPRPLLRPLREMLNTFDRTFVFGTLLPADGSRCTPLFLQVMAVTNHLRCSPLYGLLSAALADLLKVAARDDDAFLRVFGSVVDAPPSAVAADVTAMFPFLERA
eukprot:TRINITY_DN6192_c0_g1_i1.p1 TRINITY_DN6192_c0_g1~~TRINITY_DN6192_c0_g1_i1.p1  ORF type:complete len:254 (-),score=36.66 TRINITY_DN6192_c0_g1_i1:194-955(-)